MDGYPDAAMVVEIRYDDDKYVGFFIKTQHNSKSCRTRELSAEQKFTRDHWRKQVPPYAATFWKFLLTKVFERNVWEKGLSV